MTSARKMTPSCELKFGTQCVARLVDISLRDPSYFADFHPSEAATTPGRIHDFYERCISASSDPDDTDFSERDELIKGAWTVISEAGGRYTLDSAPLFSYDGQVSFSLATEPPPFTSGEIVEGVVTHHQPYGAWVRIDSLTEGLVLIVEITDEERALSESDFPSVGSRIHARVLRCFIDDGIPKASLSTRESALQGHT